MPLSEKKCSFTIYYTQFIKPDGSLAQPLPNHIEPGLLVRLYRAMVLNRMFDNKAIALQRTGRLGTYPSSLGQEAIGAAIGHCLEKDDIFAPYYRDHGAQLLRGLTMTESLLYWGGHERGSCFEQPRQDFPVCVPISTQCLHAAGAAAAIQYRRQKQVALTTLGDGGTSKGDFYEAINVAGVWKLPLVVVINNNQWAISVPLKKQTQCATLAQKAIAAGIHGEQVDGNDVVAMVQALTKAIQKARSGEGASVIEALSYRLSDHTTADDANRYRRKEETEEARKRCPIQRLKLYLCSIDAWNDTLEQKLIEETTREIEQAVDNYLAIEPQEPTSMFDYLYATLPAPLIDQYQQLQQHSSHL